MFTICPKTLEHWSLASVRSLERNNQYALDRNSLFGKSSTTLASQLLCHPLSLYSAILLALPIEWCEQRFNWRVRQLVRRLLANDQTTKGYFRVPVQRNSENFRSRRRGAQFDLGVLSCYRLSYMWWPRWRIASDYETWIYNTTHLHVLVLVKYADFFALFVLIWAAYLYCIVYAVSDCHCVCEFDLGLNSKPNSDAVTGDHEVLHYVYSRVNYVTHYYNKYSLMRYALTLGVSKVRQIEDS